MIRHGLLVLCTITMSCAASLEEYAKWASKAHAKASFPPSMPLVENLGQTTDERPVASTAIEEIQVEIAAEVARCETQWTQGIPLETIFSDLRFTYAKIIACTYGIKAGNLPFLKQALQTVSPNACDNTRKSLLMHAAHLGLYNIVAYLVQEKTVNLEAHDETGTTAFLYAAQGGHEEICRLLKIHGADDSSADGTATTALMYAAQANAPHLCSSLLSWGGTQLRNVQNKDGTTALMYACRSGADETVWILLKRKADMTLKDTAGLTAFHYALDAGHTSTLEILLGHGCSVETLDSAGMTPLMRAVNANDYNMARFLISQGAQVNATAEHTGITTLMFAAMHNNLDLVELLHNKNGNMHLEDSSHHNAFWHASQHDAVEVAQWLLAHGVDITGGSAKDVLPLQFWIDHSNEPMCLSILKRYAQRNDKGSLLSHLDHNGNTPLATACIQGNEELCKHLIDAGADSGVKDKNGTTPLMLAAERNLQAVVLYMLVNHPESIRVRDNDDHLVHDYAPEDSPLYTLLCEKHAICPQDPASLERHNSS